MPGVSNHRLWDALYSELCTLAGPSWENPLVQDLPRFLYVTDSPSSLFFQLSVSENSIQ